MPEVKKKPAMFQLDLELLLVLTGQLCLALKHPANNGLSSLFARAMAKQFLSILERESYPMPDEMRSEFHAALDGEPGLLPLLPMRLLPQHMN